jgi:hypothetical protein
MRKLASVRATTAVRREDLLIRLERFTELPLLISRGFVGTGGLVNVDFLSLPPTSRRLPHFPGADGLLRLRIEGVHPRHIEL